MAGGRVGLGSSAAGGGGQVLFLRTPRNEVSVLSLLAIGDWIDYANIVDNSKAKLADGLLTNTGPTYIPK